MTKPTTRSTYRTRTANQLWSRFYDRFHDWAKRVTRQQSLLQPEELVHETYLRLPEQRLGQLNDTRHFMGVVDRTMRGVMVDHVRAKKAAKRGGLRAEVPFEEAMAPREPSGLYTVALDDALAKLRSFNPRLAEVIELRFLRKLSVKEVAAQLEVPVTTIERGTRLAREWLRGELVGS